MTKHEKVSLRLSALAAVMELTGGEVVWEYACQYIRDALNLLDEYAPRILTLDEVKEIGEAEEGNIRSEDTVVVWVEALDGIKHDIEVLEPARLTYSYHPEWGDMEYDNCVREDVFGSDCDNRLWVKDYNRTWRVWSNKPTLEQRRGAPWEEEATTKSTTKLPPAT